MFFYFKKYFKVIFILFILILILAYVVNISSIPDNIILFDDSELALQTIAGIKIKQIVRKDNEQSVEISSSIDANSDKTRTK